MEKEAGEILVEEILSSECKGTKSKLLLVSIISLAVIKGGLLPKSISALGISLTISNTQYLIAIFLLLCTYFLLSFIQQVIADFIRWKMSFYATISKTFKKQGGISADETKGRLNVPGHNDKIDKFMKVISINNKGRMLFEIAGTIVFGIFSIVIIIIELIP